MVASLGPMMFRVCALSLMVSTVCCKDLVSSTAHLQDLLHTEGDFLHKIRDYVLKEKHRLAETTQMLAAIKRTYPTDMAHPLIHSVQHPVAALHMIDRFAHNWKNTFYHVSNVSFYLDLRGKMEPRLMALMPSQEDLRETLLSLLRLQDVYHLPTQRLSSGHILNHTSSLPLTALDCRNLAVVAMQKGMFEVALQWLREARNKNEDNQPFIDAIDKIQTVAQAGYKFLEGEEQDSDMEHDDDTDLRVHWGQEDQQDSQEEDEGDGGFSVPVKADWWLKYEALCRGEVGVQRNSPGPALWCHYQTYGVPYEVFKVEVLKWDPYIVLVHHFITDTEAGQLKQEAYEKLDRARVGGKYQGRVTDSRVGRVTWLSAENNSLGEVLGRRTGRAVGLDASDYAELYQVAVYGIGGHYEPHFDFDKTQFYTNPVLNKMMGDRIATFMIYLSDVRAGGSTVFPHLTLAVRPVKNAAVFWYNLHSDGRQDRRTLHAACPVLLGHKWVANKWIHEFGQEFHRPCPLKKQQSRPSMK